MSDRIKHECGIAMMRLLKPLDYYIEKYGTWDYGLQKMYLLLEKQHNRGQDGAGIAGLKPGVDIGNRYIFRERSNTANPIKDVFEAIYKDIDQHISMAGKDVADEPVINNNPYACNIYIGHVRYGTFGNYNIDYVHPVSRENNWRSRNLVLAGNFNLTNVRQLFDDLVDIGQYPVDYSDTVTILENIGHFLDEEVEGLFTKYKEDGFSKRDITPLIEANLNIKNVLAGASKKWDGGYTMAGMIGHGDAFVIRDPWGIRPAFYYRDDEVLVVASERPVIQTVFNLTTSMVNELDPGCGIIIKSNGKISIEQVREPKEEKKCSFERIYFSRGTDKSIYRERKMLGEQLTDTILRAVDYDIEHTVFSYIPNTAESAFFGLIKGVEDYLNQHKLDLILQNGKDIGRDKLEGIISVRPRIEKLAVKDAKLRTFITDDKTRDDLVGHVYDVTYGIISSGVDNMVVIDDSIVRGTTLKKSIIRILDRLEPKKIVIVSSSPQIRYPDCYGIDMAKMGDFIAFRAAIGLLRDSGREDIIDETYRKALKEVVKPVEEIVNVVKDIYRPFTAGQISEKISVMLRLPVINADLKIVYQSIEGLHNACPNHRGDWYFTGEYPTPGGNRVVNQSFINFIEERDERAY